MALSREEILAELKRRKTGQQPAESGPSKAEILAELKQRKAGAQQPKQEPYFGQQYIEPILNKVSEPVAAVSGGLVGLASLPFYGLDNSVEAMNAIRDEFTYEPKTAQGQENLGAVNRYIGNTNQSLLGTLPGQGLQAVAEGYNSATDAVGERSPAMGAAMKTLPAAAMMAPGLSFMQMARPNMRLMENGQPTRQLETLANKQGLSVENFTPETRAMVPVEVNPGLIRSAQSNAQNLSKDMQVKQLESGGRDAGLARYQLENGKTTSNKLGNDAIKNGWEEGTVRMVDTMNPETKKVGQNMLNMRWALKQDETNASRKNPLIPVGAELNKRINFIRAEANKARSELNRLVKSPEFARTQVDARPVVQAFRDKLDDLGVKYNNTGNGLQLNFKDSVLEFNPEAQGVIRQAIQMMRPDRRTTADSMHLLKRQLDDLIDFKKKSKDGLSEQGRDVLKNLRHEVNTVLQNSVEGYGEVNGKLHAILTTMDEFKNAFKIDLNMYSDPSTAIGNEMRKIHSRYKAGELIDNNILDVDDLAAQLGYEGSVAYGDLISLANQLDRRFGSSKSRDIVGVNQSAQRAERFATDATMGNKPGMIREGLSMAGDGINKLRGKDPEFDAYLSLKTLLSR